MKKKSFLVPTFLFLSFVVWTILVCIIDTAPIGPRNSTIGFATLNAFVHKLTGEHYCLYVITDWLGILPICVCIGFAALGFVQMIKRRSILKVDPSLILLGGIWLAVIGLYVFFELVPINYRPVLIDGRLEVSYPSSTTMLFMTVIPSSMIELRTRIKSLLICRIAIFVSALVVAFAVIGRIISGVHWMSDIIGAALAAASLVSAYSILIKRTREN